jgi:hypothetical protein
MELEHLNRNLEWMELHIGHGTLSRQQRQDSHSKRKELTVEEVVQ